MGTYNSDPEVYTLADAVADNADVKARIWNRMLQIGINTRDDFKKLEGESGGDSPFWVKQDLKAGGGDIVVFNTIGEAAGPGARGEQELTGRTSTPRMGAYQCQVDFFRDAVELTKKQLKFLATGKSIEGVVLEMLGKKMGRKRMHDMMHALKRETNATVLRPNPQTAVSRDTISKTDTLSTSFVVDAQARLKRLGANPIAYRKTKQGGAAVWSYLVFAGQDAMVDIRNDTSYQLAMTNAGDRGDDNPLFTGGLPYWQGMAFWEHVVVNPDSNDALGSPIAPEAVLGAAITSADTTFILKGGKDGTNTLNEYFRDFPGYPYKFVETDSPAADSATYYFWVLNISGGSAGKAGFYAYTGSANTGNQITAVTARLRATVSGIGNTTVGSVVWDANTMTDAHPVGSIIIPANSKGVPICENFIFGAGCALRAYGSYEMEPINEKRDYGFVRGMGYEGIWGQCAAKDTQNVPRGYVVLQSAFEHPGFAVPTP